MEGLTAKVFHTYNASNTLQNRLNLLTKDYMSVPQKVAAYNRAKTDVAVLCNHQRTVSESFIKSRDILQSKMNALVLQITELDKEVKAAKKKTHTSASAEEKAAAARSAAAAAKRTAVTGC
ncbi:DNA topoisomerase 1 [Caerostris darwini]|uniref:DNA topoisomerase 1 n=1 Tax=Caerostris darwini TaxID=1538125 RepID=A0AAV4VH03_9ARAC|nr:DNA topoisomerase 1 [Caerostris darwini]